MELFGEIENISYKKIIRENIKRIRWQGEDINSLPSKCILDFEGVTLSISRWVSPKRTRSYPYARVYDTIQREASKTVTIIPLVKDEGLGGDRDFLQWDTVSLMSLLNVYVIPAYYCRAKKSKKPDKITSQKLDSDFIVGKLRELIDYRASALHWNIKELSGSNLLWLSDRIVMCYRNISKELGVKMHSEGGLLEFIEKIKHGLEEFKNFSRKKAEEAQKRERDTMQPREQLGKGIKATLTIRNYLGGMYYFTVDEVYIEENHVYLAESKHTRKHNIPTKNDIKDALLKMILYVNISKLRLGSREVKFTPVIRLTSETVSGSFKNRDILKLEKVNRKFISSLIKEAEINGFEIWLEGMND